MPEWKKKQIGDATEGRRAVSGTTVDRVDIKLLRVCDKAGKVISEIKLENSEVGDFNV